jgi:hypothetical protein
MSKVIQAIFAGVLFTFILDFFFFLGIKLNYIDFYNIDLYYNILFADNQNIFLYALLSALFGFLIVYANNTITVVVTLLASLLALSTLIAPIGHTIGEFVLMQKETQLADEKHIYRGDIYYNGRTKITFYDKEINKMILLEKNRLKEMN